MGNQSSDLGCTNPNPNSVIEPRNLHRGNLEETQLLPSELPSTLKTESLVLKTMESKILERRTSERRNQDRQQILSESQVDDIYMRSGNDINRFFTNLQQPLSHMYMELSKKTLEGMNSKRFLSVNDAKLFLSERVLLANLKIMRLLGTKNSHSFDEKVFKNFNKLQKNLVGYLKTKYPRSGQNFVPGDLMKIFKNFNNVEHSQNDIIRMAGFYFGQSDNRELLKTIKLFLNKLIDEVDREFPKFQKMLQQKAFVIEQSSEKDTMNYKIGRKLPENISKFTNINSNSLEINSPQLFRVVIKWVGDMEDFLLNPEQEVKEKETFKVIYEEYEISDNQSIGKVHFQVDEMTSDENPEILQKLIENLKKQKDNYNKDLEELVNSMYKFQHNLIKIIEESDLKEKYVPRKEAQIIKFASSNTHFLSWMLAQKLLIVLEKLIKVGRSFANTKFMSPLDLIKFNVTDLLRALITGSKSEIMAVYKNLKDLESKGQIKIVKLKNRLMTPLNDVMIIFKMKQSFLICELQLILSDSSSQSSDQKLKNIEALNHFFYELQRSPYGVISELAVLVGYKDSKMGYGSKINFNSDQIGIPSCQKLHPTMIKEVREQFQPFICTSCSVYYGRFENVLIMKKCEDCNNFLCNKCIFSKNPHLQATELKELVAKHINKRLEDPSEKNNKKISSEINGNVIYEKIFKKVIFIRDLEKQKDVKKMNHPHFDSWIAEKSIGVQSQYFLYGQFDKGELELIPLSYDSKKRQIQFSFETHEDFYFSKKVRFEKYDFVVLYESEKVGQSPNLKEAKGQELEKELYFSLDEGQSHHVFQKKSLYFGFMIKKIWILVGEKKELAEKKQDEIADQMSYKKDFKYSSIEEYLQSEGIADDIRGPLKLSNLGLVKKHLEFFKSVPWRGNIVELNLSNNKLVALDNVFESLPNLENLLACENFLKQLIIPNELSKLKKLILKQNNIVDLVGLQNLKNIEKLDLESNSIGEFPRNLQLHKLRYLNLSNCYSLKSAAFLNKCEFPEIQSIDLNSSTSSIEDPEKNYDLKFPKLKCLIINGLYGLNKLSISSHYLERIEADSCICKAVDFSHRMLKVVSLKSNELKDTLGIFGKENNRIYSVNMNGNSLITTLPLIKSASLFSLDLSYCSISDISYLTESFCPNLQELFLNSNQITVLPKLGFKKLRALEISENPFQDIETFCQSDLPSLETLSILNYSSKYKKLYKLSGFKKLKNLTVGNYQEPDLTEFTQTNFDLLEQLTFNTCTIEKLPILVCPKLRNLNFDSVKLKDIANLRNSQFSELKKIKMYYCNCEDYNDEGELIELNPKEFNASLQIERFEKLEEVCIEYSKYIKIDNLLCPKMGQNRLKQIRICSLPMPILPYTDLPHLKVLSMSSNEIKDITPFCKSKLLALTELYLSYNQIENTVEFNFLNLEVLELQGNQIKQLKLPTMDHLSSLNISTNQLKEFPVIQTVNLKTFSFTGNPFKSLKGFESSHIPALKQFHLDSLELSEGDQNFPKIPNSKIETVYLYSCNFTDLSGLASLEKMDTLSLSSISNLKNLPSFTSKKLTSLSLEDIKLNNWEELLKSKFTSLKTLSLRSLNLKELKDLECPRLTNLSISDCENLKSIDQFFHKNPSVELESLDLYNCPELQFKESTSISGMSSISLTQLKLTDLSMIPKSENLKSFNISSCQLETIKLPNYKKLRDLNISQGSISDFTEFCSQEWPELQYLSLYNCKLEKLPALKKCPKLSSVSVVDCSVKQAQQFFDQSDLPCLTILYLDNNAIKSVPSVKNMPKLESVSMCSNQLEDCSFIENLVSKNLITINLSSNKIKQIKPMESQVQYLYLGENLIQDMSFLSQSKLPRVSDLDLNSCKIKKLSSLPSDRFPKLNYVNLNNNPIEFNQSFFKDLPQSVTYVSLTIVSTEPELPEQLMEKFKTQDRTVDITLYANEEQGQEDNYL